jgi:hypothetical protein
MHTKADILAQLEAVDYQIAATITQMSTQQFTEVTFEGWSAADHVKHLLISVKPLVKALQMPLAQMTELFGTADRPSMSYDALTAIYQERISAGLRAEDYPTIAPTGFRMPEGTTDVHSYLIEQWNSAHGRLMNVLADWTEADLDRQLIPHPAIGVITVREMLYFTVHHNGLHGNLIVSLAGMQV